MILLVSGAVSVLLTGMAIPLLRRWQVLDMPSRRSSHTAPTPRGGGVPVMVAVAVGATLGGVDPAALTVLLVAAALAVVGLVDDIRSLGSGIRLALQFVAAATLVGVIADQSEVSRAALWLPLVVVGVVAYVNAFNFMDGINGISSLTAAVAGAWFAWAGNQAGVDGVVVIGLSVVGASLGFLPWNVTGRVFLGDIGSYGLGALLAGCTVALWFHGAPAHQAGAPLLIYLADTAWTLLRRARAGARLTQAHREHVYQRLVARGVPHVGAAALVAAFTAAICFVVGAGAPAVVWPLATSLVLVALYLCTPRVVRPRRLGASR